MRRQRQIAEHREAERESDRHAGEDSRGDNADEEDQEVKIAEPLEDGLAEPEQHDEAGDGAERDGERPRRSDPGKPKCCENAIKPVPTGSAAARQALVMLQGRRRDEQLLPVHSRRPAMRSEAGRSSAAPVANVSSIARAGAGSMPTTAVIRMCSSRRNAITAPSIASHRNRIDANSSDHTSGWSKT